MAAKVRAQSHSKCRESVSVKYWLVDNQIGMYLGKPLLRGIFRKSLFHNTDFCRYLPGSAGPSAACPMRQYHTASHGKVYNTVVFQ